MTKYEELCRLFAENQPDWPELDEAGYYALPEAPPEGGGYFRCQRDGELFISLFHQDKGVDIVLSRLWGTTPERRN